MANLARINSMIKMQTKMTNNLVMLTRPVPGQSNDSTYTYQSMQKAINKVSDLIVNEILESEQKEVNPNA